MLTTPARSEKIRLPRHDAARHTVAVASGPDLLTDEALTSQREVVRAFVLKLVRDGDLADDLTQATFAKAHSARGGFEGRSSLRSWLCSIALNQVRDFFRSPVPRLETLSNDAGADLPAEDDDPEHSVQRQEMNACVGEFLLRLPKPQSDVVALHDMAELTHPEIAERLGLSVANSRVILHRGRAALKELMSLGCRVSFDATVPCERK